MESRLALSSMIGCTICNALCQKFYAYLHPYIVWYKDEYSDAEGYDPGIGQVYFYISRNIWIPPKDSELLEAGERTMPSSMCHTRIHLFDLRIGGKDTGPSPGTFSLLP